MSILDTLSAVKSAISAADMIQANNKILELQEALGNLLQEKHLAEDRVRTLEKDLQKANDLLELKENTVSAHNALWVIKTDSSYEGPYYPEAWARENILLPLAFHEYEENTKRVEFVLRYDAVWRHVHVPLSFLEEHNWAQLDSLEVSQRKKQISLAELQRKNREKQ